MALSAQNQSTSYVNLYYSIVQRAATRYFKEYYNSGKYHRNARTRVSHRYTHTHTYTCRFCKKRTGQRQIRRRARISARPALYHLAAALLFSLLFPSPLLPRHARLVRRILSLMSVTGAGSHLCGHVSAKRDVIACAAPYTRGFEFSRRTPFSFSSPSPPPGVLHSVHVSPPLRRSIQTPVMYNFDDFDRSIVTRV